MGRFLLLLFLWLGFSTHFLVAQTDCEQTLNLASAEFDAGRFYGLPKILKDCLEKGFSKEQKIRAYLLLTQAYLVLDDPISAENSYLLLLKADPEFVANPFRDPIDVYYLSKKFTATPIFTPYFKAGVNVSQPRTIYSLNTSSATDQLSDKKFYKIGFQIGGGVDWNLSNKWSVSLGLNFANKSLKTILTDNHSGYIGTFTEKQNWLDLPLFVKYSFDSGRVRPFFYGGAAINFLLGSKLAPDGVDENAPNLGSQQHSQAPDIDITSTRNRLCRSLVLGGGAKYKVGPNFFFIDVQYMVGLNNITKNGEFNSNLLKFQYQSDFFRLDNLSLSIGYVKPLYDPRKKKKVVAGLLQKLHLKKSSK